MRRAALLLPVLVAGLAAVAAAAAPPRSGKRIEVVVALREPALARAVAGSRALAARTTTNGRLDLGAVASRRYLRRLDTEQRALQNAIATRLPDATFRWRYRIVLDALAVVVDDGELGALSRVPGVVRVFPGIAYHAQLDRSPEQIGAPALWGPTLATAGQGMKIGIIDDGLDSSHPFLNPAGFAYPPGFPKGDPAYTTPKVIVARAFAPATPTYRPASLPFDPEESEHATHVAGIAAGDSGTAAQGQGGSGAAAPVVSGVAPMAYLGNYKVLTVPTDSGLGLDGNSPEIAAGIEAAVQDGMDVINLSLGEPEITPQDDLVVQAIDAAAAAGVVPVVAAGNDFDDFGLGSVSSPGSAPQAITAAAVTTTRAGAAGVIAPFSSSGPTPITSELKPDVSAPGVNILSSVPRADGLWQLFSGTSMASPHVAGAAALLRQRHPTWTVAEIKSALVSTGDPVYTDGTKSLEVSALREGGGQIDLARADTPLLFAEPTSLAFGLLKGGSTSTLSVSLSDAGGGPGPWAVSFARQGRAPGVTLSAAQSVDVPGMLAVTVTVATGAAERDVTGFVRLVLNGQTRRIPFWLRVERPLLQLEPATGITRPGDYSSTTAGRPARVSAYRYPANPPILQSPPLTGPEQVFRLHLDRPAANFGVVVLSHAKGVTVTPRVVAAADENRLTGYAGLPLDLNPYRSTFEALVPVVGAIAADAGDYSIVFETPAGATAGRFSFRYWLDDRAPPSIRLEARRVPAGSGIRFAVGDSGSGVDPASLDATIDGKPHAVTFARSTGIATVGTASVAAGAHTIVLRASDYQEAKNMENVGPILPNTRSVTARVTIAP